MLENVQILVSNKFFWKFNFSNYSSNLEKWERYDHLNLKMNKTHRVSKFPKPYHKAHG